MTHILENKKLHFFLWFLALIFVLWGFFNPQKFMGSKWDYIKNVEEQYIILIIMLMIVMWRLIQTYLVIIAKKGTDTKV